MDYFEIKAIKHKIGNTEKLKKLSNDLKYSSYVEINDCKHLCSIDSI